MAGAADAIQEATAKTDDEFTTAYVPSLRREWTHPVSGASYRIELSSAPSSEQLRACLQLIEETSEQDYRGSSIGWHPVAKRREMRSPGLRYVMVLDARDGVRGFVSLMPTYEGGWPVVYCYEIHVREELRGTGLGGLLMGLVVEAGERIEGVRKVMLTCFESNVGARAFYDKLGFGVDESSPGERKLRGKIVRPDYVILSKATAGT